LYFFNDFNDYTPPERGPTISPDGEELQKDDSLPRVTLIGTFSESKHNEHFFLTPANFFIL